MEAILEQPDKSKDYGNSPTIKITADNQKDAFDLGWMAGQMRLMKIEFVWGDVSDIKGRIFIRIPTQNLINYGTSREDN